MHIAVVERKRRSCSSLPGQLLSMSRQTRQGAGTGVLSLRGESVAPQNGETAMRDESVRVRNRQVATRPPRSMDGVLRVPI